MSLIEWKNEYSVGVASVDYEHRQLIDLINELHDDMQHSPSRRRVLEFLGEIYARIAAHFALEEKEMRESGYDQYLDHKDDHERLLDELRDMMDEYEEGEAFNDELLAGRLRAWFVVHFSTKDARLHKLLGH